jgi:hypothetical protein
MVYIPAPATNGSPEGKVNQNGFVYDDKKKKWVLAPKNVSFQNESKDDADTSSLITPPRRMQRVRSDRTEDSAITGFTEFSYDDVAVNRVIKECPSTPQEEGVEVTATGILTTLDDDVSEFLPNTNVDRFIIDDESTMFGESVLGGFNDSDMVTFPPPPPRKEASPPPPPPRSALPATYERPVSPDTSMVTQHTEEPGFIQKVPILERTISDKPFDEDIPFDERPKRQSSRNQSKPTKATTKSNMPEIIDDGSESDRSANSQEVLNDLNKLSGFMKDRKRSTKGSVFSSSSNASGGNTSRGSMTANYNRNFSRSDERPKRQSSRTQSKPTKVTTKSNMPEIIDDGSESDRSANSQEVLNDLNKLSGFMKDRKRSTKGSVFSSSSNASGGNTSRGSMTANYNRSFSRS